MLKSLPVGVILSDPEGFVFQFSPLAQKILTAAQITLKNGDSLISMVHPHQRNRLQEDLRKSTQANDCPIISEYIFYPEDAEAELWVEITFTAVQGLEHQQGPLLMLVIRNITENRMIEVMRQQNFERQELLNHVLQLLYRPNNLRDALEQVIGLIGAHTRASHVFLAENSRDGRRAEITLEWFADGVKPRTADIRELLYDQIAFLKTMEARGMVCISDQQPPSQEAAAFLKAYGIRSLAAIPVFGKDQLHGFIAYDDVAFCRTWNAEEQDLLRNISRTVSNAFARQELDEEERSQRLLAEVLKDISSVVNSTLSFEDMLDYLLTNLERVIPHQGANFALLNDENQISVTKARGYPPAIMERILNIRVPLAGWKTYEQVSRSNEPVLIPDTNQDKHWVKTPDNHWFRSYIGAAVRSRGKLLGILNVDSPFPAFFTPDHALRVQAFANQAAVAIENARLYQESQQRVNEMTSLYNIGLSLVQGLEMEQVLTTLHHQCTQVLPNDVFFVALYDEITSTLSHPLFYEQGLYHSVPSRDIRTRPGLSGTILKNRTTLFIPDLDHTELSEPPVILRQDGERTRSYIGVPIISRDQVVGIISVQMYRPNAFNAEQVRLLETIANLAAIAIENARIFNKMKQMAITDLLTGTYTRWHFRSLGQVEIDRSLRYNRPLAVMMMDIDNFKIYNDTYGHNMGDQVIQEVAKMCRQGLRTSDIIGRYGGDEFCILLPETDLSKASIIANRIRDLVASIDISPLPEQESNKLQITLSLGMAELTLVNQTIDQLLICADRALYAAKQAGRNCLRIYGVSEAPSTPTVISRKQE